METRTLRSGLVLPRLCLGTMTFGGQVDLRTAASMVDLGLERGVSFIDTANIYGAGASEEMLGRVLAGRRSQFVLASKVGGETDAAGEPVPGRLSPSAIDRALEASLRRLRVDCLDVYYLHQPDYTTPLEETLDAMERLVRAGKIRAVGVSNYASWQVCRALWLQAGRGATQVTIAQPMYNLLARGIEQEFLPMGRELGVGSWVYNPLAGGLLTGKHTGDRPAPGSRFDGNQKYLERYWHPRNHAAVAELAAAAARAGRSLVEMALGFVLHHSPAQGIVLGASSLEHLRSNLDAAVTTPLDVATLEACDRVWRELRGPVPLYNR
jgi:1-deoxyxylulose-5-phosphate synthase